MAFIKIKGWEETYHVPPEQAAEIKRQWEDDSIPYSKKLSIGAISFEKRDIKLIDLTEPKRSDDTFNQRMDEWEDYWLDLVKKSPKAKVDGYDRIRECFNNWWWVYTGDVAPEDVWRTARERAIAFFTEHQNRTIPDPTIWKDLFPNPVQQPPAAQVEGWLHVSALMPSRMLHYMTMAVDEDMSMARKHAAALARPMSGARM